MASRIAEQHVTEVSARVRNAGQASTVQKERHNAVLVLPTPVVNVQRVMQPINVGVILVIIAEVTEYATPV